MDLRAYISGGRPTRTCEDTAMVLGSAGEATTPPPPPQQRMRFFFSPCRVGPASADVESMGKIWRRENKT